MPISDDEFEQTVRELQRETEKVEMRLSQQIDALKTKPRVVPFAPPPPAVQAVQNDIRALRDDIDELRTLVLRQGRVIQGLLATLEVMALE